ncbi:MAG: metallophosphoesterase family protein [Promethearchaeota archaeon]
MGELFLKISLICIWVILSGFYFGGLYSQKQNLKAYIPIKSRIKILGLIGVIFGWLAVEIGFFATTNRYLTSIWIILLLLALLVVAPLMLGFQIYQIYTNTDPSNVLPENIKNWKHFGPYLITQSIPPLRMSIIWGINPSLITDYSLITLKVGSSPEDMHVHKSSSNYIQLLHSDKNIQLFRFNVILKLYPQGFHYQIFPNFQLYFVPASRYPQISTKLSESLRDKSKNELEIVALSDLHADGNLILQEIEQINKICPKADLIISSGDNVAKGSSWKHWGRFFAQMGDFMATRPFYTCPGNHDSDSKQKANLWSKFFPYSSQSKKKSLEEADFFHSVCHGPVHMMFLDLYNRGRKPRIPDSSQIQTLILDLEAHSDALVRVLIFHNSIFCTGEFGCDRDLERLLLPIIDKYQIQLVISGHAHILEIFRRRIPGTDQETLFLVNGGGGGKLDEILLHPSWLPTVPYHWEGRVHRAKKAPYFRGNPSHPFRNDEAVLKYQEYGKISHSWSRIIITQTDICLHAYDWQGTLLFESKISYNK